MLVQLQELLGRGPGPRPPSRLRDRPRRWLRTLTLRLLKPYSHYQREVDELVAGYLRAQAKSSSRRDQQVERLEILTRELVASVASLHRVAGGPAAAHALALAETLQDQLHALPYVADAPFKKFTTEVGDVIGFRELDLSDEPSAYEAFERIFRGPPERVIRAHLPYVALVRDHQPVLDVGCGRGEFLGMLAAENVECQGVDGDPGMVEHCQALGLPVSLAMANEYLAGLGDSTLGTVFCAQVIEHLPIDELSAFLELSRTKLKPGGLLVAETVNPHCIPSLKTFWVDPTHESPIFPEVALTLCAIAGFGEAYVFAPGFEDYEAARFQSPAYAVVASRKEALDH